MIIDAKKKDLQYRTASIGCGNIAGGYDLPGDNNIFTHAHAITIHKKTALNGVYDISYKKAIKFARKWNTTAFSGLEEMLDTVCPDFVYICVPAEEHLKILETVLNYKPKAVICEKPFGNNIRIAKEMVKKYKQNKIALVVNYTRRFDNTVRNIKYNIDKGNYGSFINAAAIYTKGTLHNGSHVIDLLRYFFGEIKAYETLSATIDYKKSDPTLDIFLKFKNNKKIHLIAANESFYSIFELDLLFSKTRIRFEEYGLKWITQHVRDDPLFPGYKDLNSRVEKPSGLNQALLNLIDNVIGHIEKGKRLFCTGEDAVKTQEICNNLIKQYTTTRNILRR